MAWERERGRWVWRGGSNPEHYGTGGSGGGGNGGAVAMILAILLVLLVCVLAGGIR